jgi:nucleotide-binding universal stress UspA family protein
MITKVVVALDGSKLAERAVGPGCTLAAKTGTPLVLLSSRWGEVLDRPRDYLEQVAAELDYERTETRLVLDRLAASAILTETDDPGVVVCMSTHGRSGIGEAILGSVAEEVLGRCDRPVLLVGPALEANAWRSEQWFQGGKLLVAFDPLDGCETLVPVAAEWCDALDLEARVVQVVVTAGGMVLDRQARAAESGALRSVAERLGRTRGPGEWEVLHGKDVAASILADAAEQPTTLIAMATHSRTGMARVTLGSVAMQVVHRSCCPVLVTRSSGR